MNAEKDLEVLTDYFNLGICLTELTNEWASKDEHYAFVNERLQVWHLLNHIQLY
jgi:8-oxoguanine DNA glycosylase, N-terminal domain